MVQHSSFRKMTFSDLPGVHAIEKSVMTGPWSEKLFSDCIKVGYDCWVLANETEIIGYGVLNYAVNEAHILTFVIASKYQHQGYGEKLLQFLISTAKAQNAEELFLEVRLSNTVAIHLYQKFNFVEVGIRKNYYPAVDSTPAEDAIIMTLPLW